jgi:hypothetical protein
MEMRGSRGPAATAHMPEPTRLLFHRAGRQGGVANELAMEGFVGVNLEGNLDQPHIVGGAARISRRMRAAVRSTRAG